MIILRLFVYLSAFFFLESVALAQIRGQLMAGQAGIYVTVATAAPGETVQLSALINAHQANLRYADGSIRGSVLLPIALTPEGTTGDAYLPLEIPLNTGDCVRILQNRNMGGRSTTSTSAEQCVIDPFDFGRLRYYFTGGAMVSKDRDNFSKTDLFIGFLLDKTYLMSNRIRVNTYFDTRLTSIPVSERPTVTLDDFVASKKAASLQVGVYAPITTTRWRNRDADYSLFLAPLAKVGFVTPTDSSDPSIVNPNKFFTSYGFGGRLGHTGRASELLSSVDIVVGRFGNFESYRNLSENDGPPEYIRKRLFRLDVEGMLTIPGTPFIIGFNANIGSSRQHEPGFSPVRDDLRFLFGARFDARRLLQKLAELNLNP